jgi:hypothetical protein
MMLSNYLYEKLKKSFNHFFIKPKIVINGLISIIFFYKAFLTLFHLELFPAFRYIFLSLKKAKKDAAAIGAIDFVQ